MPKKIGDIKYTLKIGLSDDGQRCKEQKESFAEADGTATFFGEREDFASCCMDQQMPVSKKVTKIGSSRFQYDTG